MNTAHTFRSLRPERPLPSDLIDLLENQKQYVADSTAQILRRKRMLPTMTWIGMAMVACIVIAALVGIGHLLYTSLYPEPHPLFGTTSNHLDVFDTFRIVMASGAGIILLVSMALTISRIKKDKSYLLLSHKYLAFVGDPLGVQWADLEEVTAISMNAGASGGTGAYGSAGVSVAASLDVVYENGDVEPIFVGEEFVDSELDRWQKICNGALEFS